MIHSMIILREKVISRINFFFFDTMGHQVANVCITEVDRHCNAKQL